MKRYFHFLIFMSLVSSLLMIVHNNAPVVFSYLYGWGPLFVLSTVVFAYKTFFNNVVQINLLFFIVFALVLPKIIWINMDDWYLFRQFSVFSNMLIPVTMFVWLKGNRNNKMWAKIAIISLIFIVITSVMTIVASQINPMIVRASYSSGRDEIENFMVFRRMGIGSYGFMILLVILLPPLIYFYRKAAISRRKKRILLLIMIILYLTLIEAQIFANILVATSFIIIALLEPRNHKRSIIFVFLLLFVVIIPNTFWANIMTSISGLFDTNSILREKFIGMADTLGEKQIVDASTGIGSRAARYPGLMEVFLNNPFLGNAGFNGKYNIEMVVGGHLFWMSRLALWGIFGFIAFVVLLIKNFRLVLRGLNTEFKYYYYLSIMSFIALGLLKNLTFMESFLGLFVIIPGLAMYYKTN